MAALDIAGETFGRLTALRRVENKSGTRWLCKCSCGAEKVVLTRSLRQGSTKSCGCLMREKAREAGARGTRIKVRRHAAKRALGDVVWHLTNRGYVRGYWPEHPLATGNTVLEHWHEYWIAHGKADWVISAKNMGATIHHINGVRDDNRPGNLELRWPGRHPSGWAMNDIIAILRDQGFTVIFPDDN